jgi:molybdopterin/thiamine biosynthesis adenylyltransferase
MLRFDRIRHLISPPDLNDKVVCQVGVGSGGAAVNDHLTMNGVRRWRLFDPDSYDDVNLVKHPRMRSQVGYPKVSNQKEWILDRNPDAEVEVYREDVISSPNFNQAVKGSDLVLSCSDRQEVRLFVNSIAVQNRIPCVTASVYRQGFGGEVYSYIPGSYGCFDCMGRVAGEKGWNIQGMIEPTQEEQEIVYGRNIRDFQSSGLSMDIQAIATIQARMSLNVLLPRSKLIPSRANWIIFYNRPIPNNPLSGFMRPLLFNVKPGKDCPCAEKQTATTALL